MLCNFSPPEIIAALHETTLHLNKRSGTFHFISHKWECSALVLVSCCSKNSCNRSFFSTTFLTISSHCRVMVPFQAWAVGGGSSFVLWIMDSVVHNLLAWGLRRKEPLMGCVIACWVIMHSLRASGQNPLSHQEGKQNDGKTNPTKSLV